MDDHGHLGLEIRTTSSAIVVWTYSVTQACLLPPRPSNACNEALCLFPLRWLCMPCTLLTLQIVQNQWEPIISIHRLFIRFLPTEAGETLLFDAWFLTFSCSQVALCLFPWRCEIRAVSLWAVTWHITQVHTFWTFSGGRIPQRSPPPTVVVAVFMHSRGGNVLFSVWLTLDSACLACKCSKIDAWSMYKECTW